MGYAIKKGTNEFRAVEDESWCLDGEVYSDTPPEVKPLAPDVESLRLMAYADPVNGSDRYLSEAASLIAAGSSWDSEEVKTLQSKALQVKEEVRKRYPYPEGDE